MNSFDKFVITFKMKLCGYLNLDIEKESLDIIMKTLDKKINSNKNITKMEKLLLQLIKVINPSSQTSKQDINQLLIIKIIEYLNNTKEINSKVDPEKVYNILNNVFKGTDFGKVFFPEKMELNEKIESYLELVFQYIPSNQIELIINFLKTKFQPKEVEYVQNILDGLNNRNKKSLEFLKDIILIIINYSEIDFIKELEDIKEKYIREEKNELLRCNICYSLPIIEINKNKEISIKYKCEHIPEKDILNPKNIINYRIKCAHCEKVLLNMYKNFLCSNCRNIFCNTCLQIHFRECLSLFFIPLSEVGFTCTEHKNDYKLFCSICNLNLCANCKEEHHHFSEYGYKKIIMEDKEEIKKRIYSENTVNKEILDMINLIIDDDKYLVNLQFQYFLDKLINKEIIEKCGFYEEFGNKEFKEYYSYLIKEREKGNEFYIDTYNKIKDIYINEKKPVNELQLNIEILYKKSLDSSKIINKNLSKYSLLSKYFSLWKDILNAIDLQHNKINEDISKINKVKCEIKNNALINANNKYRNHAVKLLNRSIADNLIRFLVLEYPNNFKKVDLNFKIYNNIKEINKNDKKLLAELSSRFSDEIKELIKNINPNDQENNNNIQNEDNIENMETGENGENNQNDENEEQNDTEENKNLLVFEKPIKKDEEISVIELNHILNYLFYLKEIGNYSVHPNNNHNSIQLDLYSENSYSKSDSEDDDRFIKILIETLRNYTFLKKVKPESLFECLFNGRFDMLLRFEEVYKKDIKKIKIDEQLNEEVIEEFKKFDELFNSFMLVKNSLIKHSTDKIDRTGKKLKDFFNRLNKSFNNEETALIILANIFEFEITNSCIGDNHQFISDCFNSIIKNIIKKFDNIVTELKAKIEKLKQERTEKKNILDMFEKLNQKADEINQKENEDAKNSTLNELIDFLNKDRKEEEKINHSDADAVFNTIKHNLEKLVNKEIEWMNYSYEKLSSLLFLKQNKFI